MGNSTQRIFNFFYVHFRGFLLFYDILRRRFVIQPDLGPLPLTHSEFVLVTRRGPRGFNLMRHLIRRRSILGISSANSLISLSIFFRDLLLLLPGLVSSSWSEEGQRTWSPRRHRNWKNNTSGKQNLAIMFTWDFWPSRPTIDFLH